MAKEARSSFFSRQDAKYAKARRWRAENVISFQKRSPSRREGSLFQPRLEREASFFFDPIKFPLPRAAGAPWRTLRLGARYSFPWKTVGLRASPAPGQLLHLRTGFLDQDKSCPKGRVPR